MSRTPGPDLAYRYAALRAESDQRIAAELGFTSPEHLARRLARIGRADQGRLILAARARLDAERQALAAELAPVGVREAVADAPPPPWREDMQQLIGVLADALRDDKRRGQGG